MFTGISFWSRALFLAGLMLVGAGLDYQRRGKAATRPREYGFIWLTGLIGAAVGATTDIITFSLSPEYFTLGKDLSPGASSAVRFGLQEGLSAGIIVGAICVFASQRKSAKPPLGWGEMLRLLWIPIVSALVGALLLPLLANQADPAGLLDKLRQINEMSAGAAQKFLRVWWIHTGLYAGLASGTTALSVVISRRRKRLN